MKAFPFKHRTVAQIEHANSRRRPMPADFPQVAPHLRFNALLDRYKAGASAVYRWLKEAGVECQHGQKLRPVPADFAEQCAELTKVQLQAHYRAHSDCVRRWLTEAGLSAKSYVAPARPEKCRAALPKSSPRPQILNQMGQRNLVLRDARIKSIWDEAADTLRAERWTVFRSNERGAYCEKGQHWRVGNVVITPDELLLRAERVRRKAA